MPNKPRSQVTILRNGVFIIHDYKAPQTAVLQITVSEGVNAGKSLGMWLSYDELMILRLTIDTYLNG